MTDITELAQRMKAAAEKATKGPWVTFDDDWSDDEDVVVTNEARDSDCVSPIAVIKCGGSESDDDSPYCAEQRANAAFIALANPANILELVEALEKAQKTIAFQQGEIKALLSSLESRTVKLPKPISVLHRREFTAAHCAICAYPEAEVNAALDDAGIKVEAE